MQCILCGKRLNKEDKVCPKCGKKQPLAETDPGTKRYFLKSLSPICILIGLILLPFTIIGLSLAIVISIYEKMSLLTLILIIINIIFINIIPFLLAIVFKKIK